ncbi:MAG: cytochrome c [Flavobacteriales bacterium]|nr:cytochrome c [Flavobacteriales bacterium]MBK9193531.1 cytochrome c [Flavobacteriales bacterium]
MSKHSTLLTSAALAVFALASCGGDPDSPGIEYFPDMYRSPAVEAYVDYGQDPYVAEMPDGTYDSDYADSLVLKQRMTQQARKPVQGTIAFSSDASKAAFNFPYTYANTPEDYERAGLEVKCPLPMTQENVDKGKVIYDKMCKHCHGEKGAGDGTVVNVAGYPQPGAYNGPLKTLPEGKIFHSLTYGKNIGMGSHASQLNKEERWLVTRYVQYLQNDGKLSASAPVAVADTTATPVN